jgi:hypothetical protein
MNDFFLSFEAGTMKQYCILSSIPPLFDFFLLYVPRKEKAISKVGMIG